MYIRCAKCQLKLPQAESKDNLIWGLAGVATTLAATTGFLGVGAPLIPLSSGVLALGCAGFASSKACRNISLNAAGPGSWGVECPHCQHLNFWNA